MRSVSRASGPTWRPADRARDAAPLLSALAFCALGLVLLARATSLSVGLPPDSATYLGAARSWSQGHGYVLPSVDDGALEAVTHFPPLYPGLLAALAASGADPLAAARLLNLALLCGTSLLAGALVLRAAPGSRWLPVFATAALATAPGLLWLGAAALSEPLFLLLVLAVLCPLAAHLDAPRPATLAAAAALAALAFLTRYAGAALLATGTLLLLARRVAPARRVKEAGLFLGIAGLPMLLWLLRNVLGGDTATGRSVAVHWLGAGKLREAAHTLGSWLLVDLHPGFALATAAAAGLLLLDGRARRALARAAAAPLARTLYTFTACYLGLLFVSISFFDAATPLNSRILSPVFVAGWLLALLAAHRWMRLRDGAGLRTALALLGALLVAGQIAHAVQWSSRLAERGGTLYGRTEWRDSPTVQLTRELPADTLIYTNGPDALQLLAGRNARRVPPHFLPGEQRSARDLPERMDALREELRAGGTVLVWLDRVQWRPYLVQLPRLVRELPIRRARRLQDGSIWLYDQRRDHDREWNGGGGF